MRGNRQVAVDLKSEVKRFVNPNEPLMEYRFSRKKFYRDPNHNPVTAPNTTPTPPVNP